MGVFTMHYTYVHLWSRHYDDVFCHADSLTIMYPDGKSISIQDCFTSFSVNVDGVS